MIKNKESIIKIIYNMDIRNTQIYKNNDYSIMTIKNDQSKIISFISPRDMKYIEYSKQFDTIRSNQLDIREEKKMRFCTENKIQSKEHQVEFLLLEYLDKGSYCDILKDNSITDNEIIYSILQIEINLIMIAVASIIN